ncbi:MAG: HAD-IIIC family phosphatase [Alphaproteobacteria bacterium]
MAADPKTEWRTYLSQQPKPDYTIGVSSSVTAEPLAPFLGAHLLGKKYAPQIVFGDFNQIHQTCLDHKGYFGRDDLNAIVLIWRLEDMFGGLLAQCLDNPGDAMPQLVAEVKNLAQAVGKLRKDFKGTIVAAVPPYPTMPGYEVQDIGQATSGMVVYNTLAQLWTQEISRIGRVRLLDLQGLLLNAGIKNAADARKWALYRQPYTEAFWADIGRQAGRIIAAEKISPKKCIVLDLDNTLWGGIVGEDGLEGLELGDDFPGKAFRDFQRYLKHLQSKGVMLAVASKNNPDDALEVFDKHDAMVLSRKDILVFEIHWESKVESLKRIAKKLNIGLDSFVFVDDNPKEIGEVQDRLPEVTCMMVPEELAELPLLLANTDFFDFAEVTDEDRRRTEMMAADVERQTIQENMSEDDFRKSLNLKIDVFEADKQHLARITQLINKTNQFNLTTVRRTQDEVETLAASGDALVLGMDIKDKYGDYGLVGVSILKKQNKTCIIDTLLMSCRVLGRGAEATFFSKLAEAAKSLGCDEMRGKYIPTPKNGMVKDLYPRFHFTEENGEWVMKLAAAPATPAHIDAALRLRKKAG